jgi:hypothetical protein
MSYVSTVDNVEDAVGEARFLSQAGQNHRSARVLLRRLEHVGVPRHCASGEHPERDHGREVEGADASAHAQRLLVRVGVQRRGQVLRRLAHHERGGSTRVLHDLQAAEDVASGVRERLALFVGNGQCELFCVLADQVLQLEHHALAVLHAHLLPRLVGSSSRLRRLPHLTAQARQNTATTPSSNSSWAYLILCGLRHLADHLVRRLHSREAHASAKVQQIAGPSPEAIGSVPGCAGRSTCPSWTARTCRR